MQINFSAVLINVDGKPFQTHNLFSDDIGAAVLGTLAIVSLNTLSEADRGLGAEKKIARGMLARRIYEAMVGDGKLEVTVEEAATLKETIARAYNHPLLLAAAWEAIDPESVNVSVGRAGGSAQKPKV